MFLGHGLELGSQHSGYVGALAGFALAAPDPVQWFSGPDVAQALFLIGLPGGVVATNKIVGRASLSPAVGGDGKFTSTLEEVSATISAGDLVDFEIEDFAFAPFEDGLTYVQFWVADAALVQLSAVSATISQTLGEPNYFPPRYFPNRYFAERYFG